MVTQQEKYEFIAKNWNKLTIRQIAGELDITSNSVSAAVSYMRSKGVDLPKKQVDYEKIKALIENN